MTSVLSLCGEGRVLSLWPHTLTWCNTLLPGANMYFTLMKARGCVQDNPGHNHFA